MFTLNIKNIVGVGKGGVKWNPEQSAPSVQKKTIEQQLKDSANEMKKEGEKIEKTIAYKDNESITIEYEQDGSLKLKVLTALLADLDGMSGVERSNRGMLRRIFLGGGEQKEIIGEQQLSEMLKGKTFAQIDEIYKRVTGDANGIKIMQKDEKNFREGENRQNSRFDFDHVTQSKITKFQTALIQQVDVVATMSSILLDNPDARTGLRTVLEGKTDELQAALQDPAKIKKFQETVKSSGVLKRDPSFLEKVASVLLRIGVSVGFSVFSGGIMGAYIEQGKLDVKNGKVTRDGMNLTAKAGIGDSGSVAASLDLAAIRLEGNWNDPAMRISNRVAFVMDSPDKTKASQDLVNKINTQNKIGDASATSKLSEKEQKINIQIKDLGDAYIKAQNMYLSLPDSPARTDALAHNTLIYLAKVEALQGASLKGIFASATISGWMVGLSGTSVDTSATFNKINTGAAEVEASALKPTELSPEQLQKDLKELGITNNGDVYYNQDGKELFTVPAGKKVRWNIKRMFNDKEMKIQATWEFSDAKTIVPGGTIMMAIENTEVNNSYISSNSEKVARFAKSLRATNPNMTNLETAIIHRDYDTATTGLQSMLKNSRNSTAKSLLKELATLNTPEAKKAFFDLFLTKTFGSEESRRMGADLEKGKKDIKERLRAYYDRLAKPFATQYNMEEGDVKKIFESILPTVDKNHIKTLGEIFPAGFTGLVAINQKNAKKDLVTLNKVDQQNTRIIGTPTLIEDSQLQKTIRDMVKSKITNAQVLEFQNKSPFLKDMEPSKIKDAMVGGKVSMYLSFETDAQCFNLGAIVEPTDIILPPESVDIPVISKRADGTVVGKSEISNISGGAGLGVQWGEGKGDDTQKPPKDTPSQSSNTGTGETGNLNNSTGPITNEAGGVGKIDLNPPLVNNVVVPSPPVVIPD